MDKLEQSMRDYAKHQNVSLDRSRKELRRMANETTAPIAEDSQGTALDTEILRLQADLVVLKMHLSQSLSRHNMWIALAPLYFRLLRTRLVDLFASQARLLCLVARRSLTR